MVTDKIPGIGEDLQRDLLPTQSVTPRESGAATTARDIAYPSDRAFVEQVFTRRVYGGIGIGIFGVAFGLICVLIGAVAVGVSLIVLGFLLLLYGFALGLGWVRMRWWL